MAVYERDLYAWANEQAELLREGDLARLDIPHLIEELESMGRAERRQLTRRLEILLIHLLKWQYQPALRGRSWELTVAEQRRRIVKLLHENPSLQPLLGDYLADAYDDAAFGAMRETGLSPETFPERCPYPLERVLEPGWLPE